MFLVDSQVHLWLDESPDRPWVKGARERLIKNGHRTDAFTYEECLEHMDKAGVDRVMIVPGSWEGDRIDYALKACEAHPDRFAVMARIPQNKPEEAMAMLKDWQSIPYVKGTRITFHRPIDRNWMIDGAKAGLLANPGLRLRWNWGPITVMPNATYQIGKLYPQSDNTSIDVAGWRASLTLRIH